MAIKIKIVGDYDPRGMTKATRALDDFAKKAQIALGAVAVATAALAVKSVQEFAKFEGAMTQSLAIMGDVSDAMRTEMSDAAREMAKTTTFSAEQAAESYFFLASAGLDAEASVAAMPRVAAFAQAGMFDMARATDLLTDAQSALGLTIREDAVANMANMTKVSDVLVKANTLANASVEQFSVSLTTKAGPALRAVGKDVEEGVAVLAALADQGIKAELAGTGLSIVLRDLQTKALDNKEAFAEVGVAVFDSSGEMRNLADITADLENATAGMSDEQRKATFQMLGFSDKSFAALAALMGTSEAIRFYETALRSAGGITDEVANKQLESLSAQFGLLQSAVTDVFIEIGEQLAPALKDLIPQIQALLPELGDKLVAAIKKVDFGQIVTDLGNFFTAIIENFDTIARVTGLLLSGAAALATYRVATGLATTAMAIFNSTLVLNPIGLFVAAMAGAVAITLAFSDEVEAATAGLKGKSHEEIKNRYTIKQLREEQKRLENQIESTTGYMRQNYEVQLGKVKNQISQLTYATTTSAGELNRFNNLSLQAIRNELHATADAATALNNASKQYGLARLGVLTGQASGRGAIAQQEQEQQRSAAESAFKMARERVRDLIKSSQKQLADAQKQYNQTVQDANESYAENVVNLQQTFAAKLADIVQQSQNRLRDAYRSAVAINLQTLFERDEEKSVSGLVESLRSKLAASRNLLSNAAELASAGFSQTFIEQVVSAGTETGNELAQAILTSTPQTQAELKDLFTALEQTSETGMDSLAARIYEKQGLATTALKDLYVKTQQELDQALLDEQAALEEALLAAGDAFYEAVFEIRNSFLEAISEMKDGLGGLDKTVDQFLDKLNQMLATQISLDLPSVSAPSAPAGTPTIEFMPIPSAPVKQENNFNITFQTDPTQSDEQIGQKVVQNVQKYFAGGGGIKYVAI